MDKSINIVIPVYNEGENIAATLAEITAHVRNKHRIFIVYDFDEDNTLPVVRKAMETCSNITPLKNRYGRGVLNAIKSGFETIEDGVVLVVMADLSDDLAKVDTMFEKINEGYDIVCGSRYMKGGRQIGGPRFKKLLSQLAGASLHYLVGIPTHDVTNSFKMYTKKVLKDITIESNGGFEIGMEIVVKSFLHGYKITEVPSTWRDRTAGKSNFKLWKWLPKYLKWYFRAFKTPKKSLPGTPGKSHTG
jgi:glycosyltransferase involved in cell wall biosynthesis